MKESTRRLFLALWPSAQLRAEIESATCARIQGNGRRIPSANFHVTLAFLGSVAETRIADVLECIHKTPVQPFAIDWSRVTWWQPHSLVCLEPDTADAAGVAALGDLVNRLRRALVAKGFDVDQRQYRPHVTLAREVSRSGELKAINKLHWQVNRIELIESQVSQAGSVYSAVAT